MAEQAWHQLAKTPRKSYLAKVKRLTPMQERWVKAILGLWASEVGGTVYYGGSGNGIWRFVSGWSGEEMDRFTQVFDSLSKLGYQGQELLQKAQILLWPEKSIGNLLQRAGDQDDADFVEKTILQTFTKSDPIYIVARKYYIGRHTVQELANYMQRHIAPWLTNKQCADRVRWCIELFNARVFHQMAKDLSK